MNAGDVKQQIVMVVEEQQPTLPGKMNSTEVTEYNSKFWTDTRNAESAGQQGETFFGFKQLVMQRSLNVHQYNTRLSSMMSLR